MYPFKSRARQSPPRTSRTACADVLEFGGSADALRLLAVANMAWKGDFAFYSKSRFSLAPYYKRNILVLSVTVFLASLSWQQIVPFLPLYLKEIGGGGEHFATWVSAIFAAQSLAAIIAMPFWGKMGDTYGRKPMIIRAGLCLSFVYFAMSVCRNPWQLILCRFLNGALTGFIPGSFALVGTNTPEDKAPRYVAILESCASVGLIVGPTIGATLARLAGYRASMVMSGAAVLLATIAVAALVKEPNKVGTADKTSLLQDFKVAVRSPVLSTLMLAMMVTWSFGNSVNPFLVLHMQSLGGWCPWWLPAITYSLPGIAFVLSAYRWSKVGQRVGFDRTIKIGLAGGAIGALVLGTVSNVWAFAGAYFLTGLCLASLSPSIGAITCTKVPSDFRGRAYGIQQGSGTTAALLSVLAAGQIARLFGYHAVFGLVLAIFTVGLILFNRKVKTWEPETATE